MIVTSRDMSASSRSFHLMSLFPFEFMVTSQEFMVMWF